MLIAFVPVYIKYLGIEAYGVVALFVTLQAWLGLMDLGLRPVLGREMARFTAGSHNAQSIADLLRSIEILAVVIAVAFSLVVYVVSDWLAMNWVRVERLPTASVAQALALMGLVAGLQFVESLYTSALAGLQRQVLQNVIASLAVTARALGSVVVLIWLSPTLQAFFVWQGIVSLLTVGVLAGSLCRVLPTPPNRSTFSWSALATVRTYAVGMIGIVLLSFLMTQIDKIILSRQLALSALAHYMLAWSVAGAMGLLVGPVGNALYPRFTQFAERGDTESLSRAFHWGAQITSALLGTAASLLIFFGDRILLHWTQDTSLAAEVAPLLSLIAVGTMLHGVLTVPYHLQMAHGWTSLSIILSCTAILVQIPALLWILPIKGAMGAAGIWAMLNALQIAFGAHFMFARLLREEKWRWYLQDVMPPLMASALTALALRALLPKDLGLAAELVYLLVAGAGVAIASGLSCPVGRGLLRSGLHGSKRSSLPC